MADQDFNIKVVTTADTSGLRQTREEIERVRQAAEKARQDAGAKALFARESATAPIAPTQEAGLTGTAIGLGTIVTLLTASLSKWREFNAEQDKWVDGMIKSQEKSRELGLSVADMLDAMKSAERIDTEPLQVSFDRLKQKVTVLKTEMQLAFAGGQYEDVKRYAAALGVVESQLYRVTSALERQAAAKSKAAAQDRADKQQFESSALSTSSDRTQEILKNEELARRARAAGRFEQGAALDVGTRALKETATGIELEEYKQLKAARDARDREFKPKPQEQPQAQSGKSTQPDVVQAIHELRDLWT